MRWIVTSLIVINIVAFVWQLLTREEAPSTAQVAAVNNSQAPKLQLLSELDAAERQALQAQPANQRQASNRAAEAEPLCTLIGPFPALLRAEYFIERLAALDVKGVVQEMEIPGEVGYWVFLPSQDTRKQAFATLRELQAKGIDSYVIPKGELENGISFGMFSQAELAEQRLKDMRNQGYPAELKEITRTYRETWVVIQPGVAKQLDEPSWQRLLSSEEALDRRQNFCPTVASE